MDKLDLKNTIMDDDQLVKWIDDAPGAFHISNITNDTGLQYKYAKKLEKLVEIGYIERAGARRGWYRPKEVELIEMDYKDAESNPVELWLPFDLDTLVEIYEGNIIIIAGIPNSGKTGVCFNIINENESEWNVHYFNSEMSAGELQKRLSFFLYKTIDDWKFKAYERAEKFGDVIKSGAGNLNIIDFLEVHDEFYIVGKRIKEIHDRLKGAVAIIGLQKNPGAKTGLGGYRTMEVARLAITLESGQVEITKAKNWRDPKKNPNGLIRNFKLVNGCEIISRYPWRRELET